VHLQLFAKIDPKWLKRAKRIDALGYNERRLERATSIHVSGIRTLGEAVADVELCEVGTREGLRNESDILETAIKVRFVEEIVAPGASGNLATEDLVSLFEEEGIDTGIDLELLTRTSKWLEEEALKRQLPSRVLRARLGAR